VVYRASRDETSPGIALKTIDLDTIDPSDQEIFRERLRREVSILESLSHPSVVRIFDVGVDGSLVYIAMELIPGPSLYQVLRSAYSERIRSAFRRQADRDSDLMPITIPI
jgi:eukaryotic-like serine/threonine-protein kinase